MKYQKLKIKNSLVISLIVLGALLFTGVVGAGLIKAEETNNYPPIVQKLVERFGLNEDEVKAVFDEARQERHQERLAHFEEGLNQAVADGKITQEQKELILAKKEEMRAKHEEMRSLSWEERRTAMEQQKEEMKTWAEENGIDSTQLFPFGPKGFFGGHFGPGWGDK